MRVTVTQPRRETDIESGKEFTAWWRNNNGVLFKVRAKASRSRGFCGSLVYWILIDRDDNCFRFQMLLPLFLYPLAVIGAEKINGRNSRFISGRPGERNAYQAQPG